MGLVIGGGASDSVPVPDTFKTVLETGANPGTPAAIATVANLLPGNAVVSGTTVADTFPASPQVDLTGDGLLYMCAVAANDATSRTLKAKLVIDGVEVLDLTSAAVSAQHTGIQLLGGGVVSYPGGAYAVRFKQSCKIYAATSLGETDGAYIKYSAAYKAG